MLVKKMYIIVVLFFKAFMPSFALTSDEVIALLHEIDEQSTRFNNRIIYAEEYNFGIPGGSNWLVNWEGNTVIGRIEFSMIYVVDADTREILFREIIRGTAKLGISTVKALT